MKQIKTLYRWMSGTRSDVQMRETRSDLLQFRFFFLCSPSELRDEVMREIMETWKHITWKYTFLCIYIYMDTCVFTFIHYVHYNSLCLIEIVYVYTWIYVSKVAWDPRFCIHKLRLHGSNLAQIDKQCVYYTCMIITRDDYVDVNILSMN